jgi:hypothetical protein
MKKTNHLRVQRDYGEKGWKPQDFSDDELKNLVGEILKVAKKILVLKK